MDDHYAYCIMPIDENISLEPWTAEGEYLCFVSNKTNPTCIVSKLHLFLLMGSPF